MWVGLVRNRSLAQRSNALGHAPSSIVTGRAGGFRSLVERIVLGKVGAAGGQVSLLFAIHDVLELRRAMLGHR